LEEWGKEKNEEILTPLGRTSRAKGAFTKKKQQKEDKREKTAGLHRRKEERVGKV